MSALQDICTRFPTLSSCQNNPGPPAPTAAPNVPSNGLATPPNIPNSNDYCENYKENFGAYCGGSSSEPSIVSFCNSYGVRCRGWNVVQPTPQTPPAPIVTVPTPRSPFATQPPPVQPVPQWPTGGAAPVQPNRGLLGSQIGAGQALGGSQGQKSIPSWLQSGQPLAGLGGSSPNLPTFGGPVNGGLGLGTGWQVPFVGASQGLNVVPTQGLLAGRGLNVAGLGFSQSGGINYGGIPGLSNLNNAWGLGPSALNGINGKRRRRSILLKTLGLLEN